MFGVEGAVSECLSGFLVQHILKILVVPCVDLLYLVGGTEAVEEVENGPFNYYGAPDADHVIIAMGSVCDTIEETIDLNV